MVRVHGLYGDSITRVAAFEAGVLEGVIDTVHDAAVPFPKETNSINPPSDPHHAVA